MFKKKDIILIVVILAVCSALYAGIQLFIKKDGRIAAIKVDGKVVRELPLNMDTEVIIDGYSGGINKVIIKDGTACMVDADCPDKLCVNMGKISKTGETIVCLPHRVVIEISGGAEAVDSIVQ